MDHAPNQKPFSVRQQVKEFLFLGVITVAALVLWPVVLLLLLWASWAERMLYPIPATMEEKIFGSFHLFIAVAGIVIGITTLILMIANLFGWQWLTWQWSLAVYGLAFLAFATVSAVQMFLEKPFLKGETA